jgi:hypothetical protein
LTESLLISVHKALFSFFKICSSETFGSTSFYACILKTACVRVFRDGDLAVLWLSFIHFQKCSGLEDGASDHPNYIHLSRFLVRLESEGNLTWETPVLFLYFSVQ